MLVERKISEFVHDQQRRFGIDPELAHERVIDLRGEQVIEHIHGRGEKHALVGLTGTPSDDFGQECFAGAWITDNDHASAFGEEVEIHEPQDSSLQLQAALVVFEVKAVDRIAGVQTGEAEATLATALFLFDSDMATGR